MSTIDTCLICGTKWEVTQPNKPPDRCCRDHKNLRRTTSTWNVPWVVVCGSIYTAPAPGEPWDSGIRVAKMDREEPRTEPTERDFNCHAIVELHNASLENTLALCSQANRLATGV